MHRQYAPYHYPYRYPAGFFDRRRLPPKETFWRRSWPCLFTVIIATLMLLLTIAIFSLEVASLAVDPSNDLSNTASTGAGIWCSVFFIIPVVFMYLLVSIYRMSRRWATYTLIAHLVALAFICILIGLDANAVTPYNTSVSTAPTKIKLLKGQLAVAVLMLIFPFCFFAAYIYAAFMSLFPLRHCGYSVHPPFPTPSDFAKF